MDPEVNHLFKIWNEYLHLKTPIENKPWTGLYNQVLLIYELSVNCPKGFQSSSEWGGPNAEVRVLVLPLGIILDESSEGILRSKLYGAMFGKYFEKIKMRDSL